MSHFFTAAYLCTVALPQVCTEFYLGHISVANQTACYQQLEDTNPVKSIKLEDNRGQWYLDRYICEPLRQ